MLNVAPQIFILDIVNNKIFFPFFLFFFCFKIAKAGSIEIDFTFS